MAEKLDLSSILAPNSTAASPLTPKKPSAVDKLLEPEPPVTHREFGDVDAMRSSVFSGVVDALSKKYPLENTRHRLELRSVAYKDEKPFTLNDQKRAIMQGHSLDRKLHGEWHLIDKVSGQTVDKKAGVIAHVPYVTNRGTFIYQGNEYTIANQMRLKPGVYTRQKENGILEAHFNVKQGTGPSFRLYMEPETGIFRLGVGQSTLKLYPILKSMGVQDRELEKHWGAELLQKNIEAEDPRAVARAFAKLVNTRAELATSEANKDEGSNLWKEAASHTPTVAVDFDGTISEDIGFPRMGEPRPGVQKALKEFQSRGWHIVIFTVRGKDHEQNIKDFMNKHDLPFDYINKHPNQPEDASGKVIADVYIDDRAVNAQQPWKEITRLAIRKMNKHADCLTLAETLDTLEKTASIGSKVSDRKWSYLWFTGTIRADDSKTEKPWVYLEVHKGMCESAYHSLKAEGVECEPKHENPHITLLQGDEAKDFRKKHGHAWKGVAKDGQKVRFRLMKLVDLVPHGWTDKYDRVWFIECESPGLKDYRKDLGLPALPVHRETGHLCRFHITFAVHRNTSKRAEELFTNARAYAWEARLENMFTKTAGGDEQGIKIKEVFDKMELDPSVTELTLGQKYNNVGTPALLRASQKLLHISRKEEEVDDRDSLAYQTIHSPEDFFAERIRKDAGQMSKKLLWKSTLRGSVQHIPTGALTPQIRSVLLRSGMGQPLEEINPFEIHDQNTRVLRLGEGGIPSTDAVPDEARNVQPSHFGFIDPIRAPESEKIGVDARLAHGTVKGSDGHVYTTMFNPRTGAPEKISSETASKSVVAFPGEMEKDTPKVRAMVKSRQVEYVDRKDVDYALPSPNNMFAASSNLVPLVSGIKGGRLLMGAKFVMQALPLQSPEAPLVQNLYEGEQSFDDLYGERVGAIRAKGPGTVVAMDKNAITMRYADGKKEVHELYDNFPFNRKTLIHNTPTVMIGDRVGAGQLLAHSNYTDARGTMAVGTNLSTAYIAWKGLNFEDAIVISESAAKKLASEHMYQNVLEADEHTDIGRKQFVSMYPAKFAKEQLAQIGDDGVVKPGSKVKHGDPLVLALSKTQIDSLHRGHKPMFTDATVTWDHDFDGEVTDVDKTKDGGYNVTVKAYAASQEGDKLSGRYGDKGVISRIVPDHQMPHDKNGKPIEIILNPLGVISRANPSQVFETLLGKIARQTGKPYKVPSFMSEHLNEFVEKELKRAGLKDTEDLTDPETGRKIPSVLTGDRFIMKLHHTAESKGRGRDTGSYTSEGLPAKGGEFGAKRIANMEINALLSHGATNVLRDAQVVRGQRNDDYWRAFRLGLTPPSPKVPMIYNKFLSYLQGAGINVKKDGNRLQLFALTDKDIDKISTGEITSGETVSGDKLKPVQGGLFDESLTGGHGGNRWTHIKLAEAIPNPLMEEPIRRMLGLTQKKFEEVLAGREELHGKTGSAGVHEALARINLESSIDYYKGIVQDGARSKRDNAVKILGYLNTLQKNKMRPEDWLMTKVPVVPPALRPITTFREMQLAADPNYLYRDLISANQDLKEMKGVVHDKQLGAERLQVYNAFKAVAGLGDPVQPKTLEKKVRGLLQHVFGASPKLGMFQRRVLGSPVDVVGRAVITPNPDLNMDQVGLPEPKAWTIYRPFIVRKLIRRGMPAQQAARAVADQSDVARKAMLEEIAERPVIINRAPTLHRYGFMAAWPVLTKGETLQVPPTVCAGFNADFDGDAMNYHVPVDDSAVKDAIEKMMPSKNLKTTRDFKVHYLPRNEFLMGLYLASTSKDKRKQQKVFRSKKDAIAAYNRGELNIGDPVSVQE